jgi:dTDP-glucose 4,6-dehydratase
MRGLIAVRKQYRSYHATKAASDHIAKAWHRTYGGVPVMVSNAQTIMGPINFLKSLFR